ncbi:LAGLIDADG DNA endonuclease family protein [Nonomuraea fuscirosea]|uniref:LAGLIDADG DNA endonuclease family protein n=1 Tax=Nonomuraea fuscirosea TaxID=1291556 RepID=A0A2T0N2E4_9ACTN|nr:LAGLIDADG family homing endonuclease [Nonomuraea fuscirosea]PRX66158.1 LAGLIDADG DNA endonuclease family protein [Nonomuraea fuscirosea]
MSRLAVSAADELADESASDWEDAAEEVFPELYPCPGEECKKTGKLQRVNKNGRMRKHKTDKRDVLPCTGSGAPILTARIPRRSKSGFYKDPATGVLLRSVTTILNQGSAHEALVYWAAKVTAETAMDNVIDMLAASRTEEGREQFIRWLKQEPNRRKDERADVGKAVHKLVECRILGEPAPVRLLANEELRPYIFHFNRWVTEWEIDFEASEMVVANYDEPYGGTLDYLFRSVPLARKLGVPEDTIFPGDTKGLALDTPLPTPTGWTTMKDVQVGDTLFDSDGRPCTVTEVSEVHYRDCYRVTFDDGSSVICDDEHLWWTESGHPQWKKFGVHSTVEVAATLKAYGKTHHRVPVAEPLNIPQAALRIEPYVLGCWLGDGKHTSGEISSQDQEIFDNIEACGYTVGPQQKLSRPGGCPVRTVLGLVLDLRVLDLFGNKHIPATYLRSSKEQRLALLQGLMDTDGTWNKRRKCAQIVSASKEFASSIRELLLSLGQRVVMFEMNHTGFKAGKHYLVTFTPRGINPFRLTRKAELVNVPSTTRASRRMIVSVEQTLTVPTKCIAVNSPNRTYLCGKEMIPTHNTGGTLNGTTYDGSVHGVYAEAGLQMAAYRMAPWGWERDGTRIKLPPRHDVGVILHLRPEGYNLYPARCGDDMYEIFQTIRKVAEFNTGLAKNVIGEPLTLADDDPTDEIKEEAA